MYYIIIVHTTHVLYVTTTDDLLEVFSKRAVSGYMMRTKHTETNKLLGSRSKQLWSSITSLVHNRHPCSTLQRESGVLGETSISIIIFPKCIYVTELDFPAMHSAELLCSTVDTFNGVKTIYFFINCLHCLYIWS